MPGDPVVPCRVALFGVVCAKSGAQQQRSRFLENSAVNFGTDRPLEGRGKEFERRWCCAEPKLQSFFV